MLRRRDGWISIRLIGVAVMSVAVVLSGGWFIVSVAQPTLSTPRGTTGRVWGHADAPVTIDMYGDFQCGDCRRAEQTLRKIAPRYIDTGRAKVVFHNFASLGEESDLAAQAAECANEQGQFWSYASYLYDHQMGENAGAFSRVNLKRFAPALGLDPAAFNACVDSSKYALMIVLERGHATALGMHAPPSFEINGQLIPGVPSEKQLGALIDSHQSNGSASLERMFRGGTLPLANHEAS